MLTKEMNLKYMLDFKPNDEDMAMLDLDVVTYLKVSLVSIDKEINYNFIRFFFDKEKMRELNLYFKDLNKTVFYDFTYAKDEDTRVITIFELYSLKTLSDTESYIEEILNEYTHDAEVIIDIYSHDNHEHRISNLDGVVKNDHLK